MVLSLALSFCGGRPIIRKSASVQVHRLAGIAAWPSPWRSPLKPLGQASHAWASSVFTPKPEPGRFGQDHCTGRGDELPHQPDRWM